jgi:tetratricopeptide (TPR) repeat protein
MLRPKKHITRQKLKEDKFVTETLRVANWVKANQNKLLGAGIGVIVVLLISWGSFSARRAAESEAGILTLQAGYALEMNDLLTAKSQLYRAAETFGRVPSAGRATLMLAQVYFRLGSVDSSRIYYQRYLDRFGKTKELKAVAGAGLAACLEQQGDFLAAASGYEAAADDFDDHPRAANYLLQAGRCYRLAGRSMEAVSAYERLKLDFAGSAEADRASIEMAQMAREGG